MDSDCLMVSPARSCSLTEQQIKRSAVEQSHELFMWNKEVRIIMFIKNCFETFDLFALCGFSFVRHASLFIVADRTHPTCLSVKFKACASSAFLLSKKILKRIFCKDVKTLDKHLMVM